MSTVITVENLGKKYLLRHQSGQQPYVALRDVLSDGVRNFGRMLLGQGNASARGAEREEFWALRDVSFEVGQGDRIGIIGRNGAGKSTLLKILSRITEPTTGSVRIRGRVASLLEVGTGFHPELTGRENIFLNGAILGMGRAEIKKKFDEIVDFAEIEKFLDTPVKRYSSGMYVRLAFAVAAHLEPEILVVDEVLAVGDAQFQKKCLGKMENVSTKEGRTVLFVSHNMGAVNQLCNKGILLDSGQLAFKGFVPQVITNYMTININSQSKIELSNYSKRSGSKDVLFVSAEICNSNYIVCDKFSIGENIIFKFKVKIKPKYINNKIKLAVQLRSADGINLCNMIDVDSHFEITNCREFEKILVKLTDIRFYPGMYYVGFWAGDITSSDTFDHIEDCLNFEVIGGGNLTARNLPRSAGLLFLTPEWERSCFQ
jgi:lipopolysaccharide transport system ATP-binding protein